MLIQFAPEVYSVQKRAVFIYQKLNIIFFPKQTPLSYDYVLVAKTSENQERSVYKKQIEYIEELKKKNMKVTVSQEY